ncbi:hypothetical protein EIN_146160 [Entamoeba invadens IP1]|uniref:MRH domain-containing protein n=1 Tax=Entamoeba invadens IP1 TaxID=370355 RepID=L7FL41_ENTIV|nr:hypothetical protein EIN_146160 [Entamoeba invadens IP1]ELP87622.1 hypothetical protein EIN_146160 [Entamoeba invadens IP1]|eukprot:XP_004254393.1 hypothetical protein EIN_146160 [Entamoeba invadens IP1]
MPLIFYLISLTSSQFPFLNYDIQFEEKCYTLPTGELYNVDYNGKTYHCSIPIHKNTTISNEDQFEALRHPTCYAYDDTYFRYVLCPGRNVTQQRIISNTKVGEIVLGSSVQSVKYGHNYIKEIYTDGNLCLGLGRRSIEVKYFCSEKTLSPVFGGVEETEPCKYTLQWQIPHFCNHQVFDEFNTENKVRCCKSVIKEDSMRAMTKVPTDLLHTSKGS